MSPEEAKRLADEYQRKVLAELINFIPNPNTTTTNNEKETPRHRLN